MQSEFTIRNPREFLSISIYRKWEWIKTELKNNYTDQGLRVTIENFFKDLWKGLYIADDSYKRIFWHSRTSWYMENRRIKIKTTLWTEDKRRYSFHRIHNFFDVLKKIQIRDGFKGFTNTSIHQRWLKLEMDFGRTISWSRIREIRTFRVVKEDPVSKSDYAQNSTILSIFRLSETNFVSQNQIGVKNKLKLI